jgi:nucleoside-diphosphate-sugar epimerase
MPRSGRRPRRSAARPSSSPAARDSWASTSPAISWNTPRPSASERVIALDTFLLDKPAWLTDLAEANPGLLHLQAFDISKDDLPPSPARRRQGFVVHGASIASPTFYRKYPVETLDANIWGLRHILDLYRGRDTLKGLLFFSSSEIYGDPDPSAIPTPETYRGNVSCHGPRACYDESKRFGETMAWVYANQFDMPITVARPFNNYGPGMRLGDKRLPADFALAVTEGRDLVILSDGTPTRTFCYVADAVAGYLLCLLHGSYDYFNIGIDKPEIMVRDWPRSTARPGGGLRLRRPGPLRGKRRSRLSGGQPQPPLPGHRQGARDAGLRAHDPRGGRRETLS